MFDEKFAIYGGTFDPVHMGHLIVAEEALAAFNLDSIYFLPVFSPPHKSDRSGNVEDRLKMLELAISDNPKFKIDKREIYAEKACYTIDTISQISKEKNIDRPAMIIGGDSFRDLESWHEWQELLKKTRLLVCARLGVDDDFGHRLEKYRAMGGEISFFGRFHTDFSSSKIRQSIRKKESLKYIIPEKVIAYIKSRGLYFD